MTVDRTPPAPTQIPWCARRKVSSFPPGFIPPRLYERNLEQNQLLASCCRHPENHEIEARKSHPKELTPDIYIFHCSCGRKHTVFCIGSRDPKVGAVHVKERDGGLKRYEFELRDDLTGEVRRDDRPEWR